MSIEPQHRDAPDRSPRPDRSTRTPIAPAEGRLGVLVAGVGAVASTLIAGVELARRGLGVPVGSLTQLGHLPVRAGRDRGGRGDAAREVPIRDALPLAGLDDLVFTGWDPVESDVFGAAQSSGVLPPEQLRLVEDELRAIETLPAVFDADAVPRLRARRTKPGGHRERVAALRADIEGFRSRAGVQRAVMVFVGSTEVLRAPGPAVRSLDAFEAALDRDDPSLTPSLLYAYAALQEGAPFVNGTPNLAADAPALLELALARGVPVAGKDLKTGQTMLKTALAPALQARMLGLRGWYSTNILGNRDGEVLEEPGSFRAKEATKRSVLDGLLRADLNPELYAEYHHKVRIDYYPPRGDQKEGWDNIDIFGWLGMPMQIKVNFLCRDSILAAPVVLDLVLLSDLAARAGRAGIQDWLSFYFKSPMTPVGGTALHDLFAQHRELVDALQELATAARGGDGLARAA